MLNRESRSAKVLFKPAKGGNWDKDAGRFVFRRKEWNEDETKDETTRSIHQRRAEDHVLGRGERMLTTIRSDSGRVIPRS